MTQELLRLALGSPSLKINGVTVQLGDPRGPTELQQVFMNATEREQCIGGAKRGGKSVALCQKAIMLSVMFPGNRGYLIRQDLTALRESLLVTFWTICPKELILNHHPTYRTITIRTPGAPSTIIYTGLSDETEEESSKGKESGWFAIDEPSEIKEAAYRMYLAQLCWKLPDGSFPPYMALLGTNPEAGWVENRFKSLIEQTSDSRRVASNGERIFIRALPRDNPYLPPGWEQRERLNEPEAWVKKYLDGSWEVSEGQVFKEFSREIHVLDALPPGLLARLMLIGSLDHATTGVTCFAVDGVDSDGNIFALGEYYQENRLISEHAKEICTLADFWVDACGKRQAAKLKANRDPTVSPAFHGFEYVLVDPSTQAKSLQNQTALWSVQDEYRRNGVPTQAAWNAVEVGINLLQEYLHIKPTHIHPLAGVRGSPSFFILRDTNPNGIRELIGLRKTIGPEGKPKYIGPDHWIDNQRYIVMSRPAPPRFTGTDVVALDTQSRMAQRALDRFDRTFGKPVEDNSWFPGGNQSQVNQWWPTRID